MQHVFDVEVYSNYTLVMFKNLASGKIRYFEQFPGLTIDRTGLRKMMSTGELISFNGISYDLPIVSYILTGNDAAACKVLSDALIVDGTPPWKMGVEVIPCDHIDLIEVAPGQASLKIYGGRLNTQKMQDLPIEPGASIIPADRAKLREYCANDLQMTEELYRKLTPQIDLRRKMGVEYGVDLRSKSDAQIAETVIRMRVEEALGDRVSKPKIEAGTEYKYRCPGRIQFQTPALQDLLNDIRCASFVVNKTGGFDMPAALEGRKITIGGSTYKLGIGGLHSTEKSTYHVADDHTLLIDRDVASYYPNIILQLGLYPKHMGLAFLDVYRRIVEQRLAAKRSGDSVTADALKICVNGSFGKLGSKYSVLYSPDLMVQVTVTGQLALLMLIEAIELAGIPVVSANTDGIVVKCPTAKLGTLNSLVAVWEFFTGFETEETRYAALYSRDVNTYLAVKTDGKTKGKGVFAATGLMKSSANTICTDAVVAHLCRGTPLAQTIVECDDPRKFVTVRTVAGGAQKNGTYLGKAIRWYYAKGASGAIHYIKNNNRVAKSEGAKPLMQLPDTLPKDVDYDWYIQEAESLLHDLGVRQAALI